MTAAAALLCAPRPALAQPTGGTVVQGSAAISQSGSATNIDQSTNRAVIDWQGFSIGSRESVNFYQPTNLSVTLNRVIGNERSVIAGALNANGNVFIVNSAGVLFTRNAQVNVGGLVASTLDISNAAFMAGNYRFSGSSAAAVVNRGNIHAADGGYVALLGRTVSNEGAIVATLGSIALASGDKITLNFGGDSLVDVTIDKGTYDALVQNKGLIQADGGRVAMTAKAADAVLSAQVNNSGVVQARTLVDLTGAAASRGTVRVGQIKLLASGGTTKVSGKLDASAPQGGRGGVIETSGDKVKIADDAVITTKAASGRNGDWIIDPDGFTIAASGGDITGAALGAQLESNNVAIYSTQGSGASGNIDVNDAVSWAASTTLTFNATNNIDINAAIYASGASAGLVLNYGDYARTGAAASGADYHIANVTTNSDGSLTIGGASVTLSGAGATFSVNGQSYTLIHSMADLEKISPPVLDANGRQVISDWDGLPVFAPATGHYALAQDLDASGKTYSSAVVHELTGTLAGLGHKVANLTIADVTDHGNDALIGSIGSIDGASPGVVRDIGLVDAHISGAGFEIAGLAGASWSGSTISNAYVIGSTVTGIGDVGGLVGQNRGAIDNAHTVVTIFATAAGQNVGGLAGSTYGIISNSTAKGTVTAAGIPHDTGGLDQSFNIGGLVGSNAGQIVNSQAYVDIVTTESLTVGGLAGLNSGVITGSSAAGTLTASWSNLQVGGGAYGGLVGANSGGTIIASSTVVNVTVRAGSGIIDGQSYDAYIEGVGGLVGRNESSWDGSGGVISNSSATGSVTGHGVVFDVGGLVGTHIFGAVTGSSANGPVTVDKDYGSVGGLIGSLWDSGSTISGNRWNIDTTGQSEGVGAGASDGVTGVHNPPTPLAETAAAHAAMRAANVIVADARATTSSGRSLEATTGAGKRAVDLMASTAIEDQLVLEEEPARAPATERPHTRRHAALAPRPHPSSAGAGYGARIRSIDVDGQRYEMNDGSSKPKDR